MGAIGRRWLCNLLRGVLLALLLLAGRAAAQPLGLSPCDQRPTFIDPPWVTSDAFCAERVIVDSEAREMAFTALAVAPDGTLYAARPLAGQVLALTDGDGDGLPETPSVAAEGLTLPNGLVWHEDALYISGGAHLYRLRDGELTTLVDDLPSGSGMWTGGVAVSADGRLVVGIGAACDACAGAGEDERAAILSFDLDGGDRRIEARGLRQPQDLALRGESVWVTDSARDSLQAGLLDELNRLERGAHYGFPFCVGGENRPDVVGEFDCTAATAPALTLPAGSLPVGLAAYQGDAFPHLNGSLLVVQAGADHQIELQGFTLIAVPFDAEGMPGDPEILLPVLPAYNPAWDSLNLQQMHYQGSGFWPHHPWDVAVSPEGWLYISAGGGRVWALRPR